jgi:hypothetical protein
MVPRPLCVILAFTPSRHCSENFTGCVSQNELRSDLASSFSAVDNVQLQRHRMLQLKCVPWLTCRLEWSHNKDCVLRQRQYCSIVPRAARVTIGDRAFAVFRRLLKTELFSFSYNRPTQINDYCKLFKSHTHCVCASLYVTWPCISFIYVIFCQSF